MRVRADENREVATGPVAVIGRDVPMLSTWLDALTSIELMLSLTVGEVCGDGMAVLLTAVISIDSGV